MNRQKLTVTIGIPVYNEEKNIRFLLDSLLRQNETYYKIQKIIVISDSSSDNSNKIITSFREHRIQLIINRTRKGQIYTQNTVFSLANTDVVVLFEADTC